MSIRSFFVPALGLAAMAVAGHAQALEASGQAVSVLRNTAASGPGGDRALAAKAPVYAGDVIKTDRRGTAQILFADDTKMVIGPNSQVTVDSFVYQGPSKPGTFAINAVRGSFRFITGVSAKNAYSITTPTATIGVRGTAFDGHVAADGKTTLAMWHGSVRICDKQKPRRHCTVLSGACSVIQVDPGGGFNWQKDVYKRTALIQRSVPFAFRQNRLAGGFRVASRGCEIHNLDPGVHRGSEPDRNLPAPEPTRAMAPSVPPAISAPTPSVGVPSSPAPTTDNTCTGNCGVGVGNGGGNGTQNEGNGNVIN